MDLTGEMPCFFQPSPDPKAGRHTSLPKVSTPSSSALQSSPA
jgi:hypothetical protein